MATVCEDLDHILTREGLGPVVKSDESFIERLRAIANCAQ
jgi:hypothetical protein